MPTSRSGSSTPTISWRPDQARRALAEGAVGRVAAQLGTSLVETAYAIHTTSNHNMIAAIEDITVNEGIDPRDSYMVCGGAPLPAISARWRASSESGASWCPSWRPA